MKKTIQKSTINCAKAKYKLDNLEPGDILFCASKGKESKVIRAATNSDFSHVAIYAGDNNFVEAADYGVINFNIQRFGILSEKNVAVHRLQAGPDSKEIAARAGALAEMYYDHDYWTEGAVWSAFKNLRRLTKMAEPTPAKGFFCSFLVAKLFQDAGQPLCEGLEPSEIHPGNLRESRSLKDVSKETIVKLDEHEERIDLLDGRSRETPIQKLALRKKEILKPLRKLFKENEISEPTILEHVVCLLIVEENAEIRDRLDIVVSEHLKSTNFSELPLLALRETIVMQNGVFEGCKYSELCREKLADLLEDYELRREKSIAKRFFYRKQLEQLLEFEQKYRVKLKTAREWESFYENYCEFFMMSIYTVSSIIDDLAKHLRQRKGEGLD